MDYAEMLKKGKEQLPEDIQESSRFEVPKIKGSLQGNKTVLSNLIQIAQHIGRKPEHLIKYLSRELGMPAEIKGNFVIFTGKGSSSRINEKIEEYTEKLVICKECGKPDTELKKQHTIYVMKCQACGARYSVTSKV